MLHSLFVNRGLSTVTVRIKGHKLDLGSAQIHANAYHGVIPNVPSRHSVQSLAPGAAGRA